MVITVIYVSKIVSFVLIPLLLWKLLAVEHARPIEFAILLNTVIVSLTRNSKLKHNRLIKCCKDYSPIITIYYDLSEHHELIFILFSIKQTSNIRNILKKLIFFFILVSMFKTDENGIYMFKSCNNLNDSIVVIFFYIKNLSCEILPCRKIGQSQPRLII